MPRNNEAEEREELLHNDSNGQFDISPHELSELIDPKNYDLLKKMGGVSKICSMISVDTSVGLSADEGSSNSNENAFSDRQTHFGKNILPEPKSKTFLQLLWAAYNDKILIMLR
jgi:Ca2+-transporting ATPase